MGLIHCALRGLLADWESSTLQLVELSDALFRILGPAPSAPQRGLVPADGIVRKHLQAILFNKQICRHEHGNCGSHTKSLFDVADQVVRIFESHVKANETISVCTSVWRFLQIGRYDQTRYPTPAIAHLE